jgi:hypothetical protein
VPGVFISYRRQDTSGIAGRLYDRLADWFGDAQVFMDVDNIELGVDFAGAITRAVGTCEVLLAVIGPGWVAATGKDGRRRLEDPDDVVRLEVEAALDRDVRVIPVLVGGAAMPQRGELPGGLAKLARRNGLSVRHETFRSDVTGWSERSSKSETPKCPLPSLRCPQYRWLRARRPCRLLPRSCRCSGYPSTWRRWRSARMGSCLPPSTTTWCGCGRYLGEIVGVVARRSAKA